MLGVTAQDGQAGLFGSADPLLPRLAAALAADPGPVTVMVHGYKYRPGHPEHCPFEKILSPAPVRRGPRVVSWPRRLGLRGRPGAGIGLGFGWDARGGLRAAHERAAESGDTLARLLAELREIAPDRPVRLLAHSMGARVALRALGQSAPGTVSHAILMAAAEFDATARAALTTPGGADCRVLNVTSRENDLFDFLSERLLPPPARGARMLGAGTLELPNLAHLQIDDPRALAALRQAGFAVAGPERRVCHWSPYLRAGLFPLYRAVLSDRLPLHRLRAILPAATQPRWSGLWRAPSPRTPRPRGTARI
jgi:pimeloyl-ACP methyl ester carboxylesterase